MTSFLDTDIKSLALCIQECVGDFSIEPQSKYLAHFLLGYKQLSLNRCCELLRKPKAKRLIWKLINCESDFLGPTPRAIGIDLVISQSREEIQQSLNVKHLKVDTGTEAESIFPIIPEIKDSFLYSNKFYMWIRYYSTQPIKFHNDAYHIVQIGNSNTVYEVYMPKLKISEDPITLCRAIDKIELAGGQIVFCSEMQFLKNRTLLFISNYIKFHFCYKKHAAIFEIHTFSDYALLNCLMTNSFLFLNSKNLTMMPDTTHGPLIQYTGERAKLYYNKFLNKPHYNNEGSRATISMDGPSDIGACSNYVEVVSRIDVTNTDYLETAL